MIRNVSELFPGLNQCFACSDSQRKVQHLAVDVFPGSFLSVCQCSRAGRSVGRPSHGRRIPVRTTPLCKRAGVGGGRGRSEVTAVRDAHLIQKSYADSALGGAKCVTHFIGRGFFSFDLSCVAFCAREAEPCERRRPGR